MKNNLFSKINLFNNKLGTNSYYSYLKKFNKIFNDIKKDIKDAKKTLNILDKNFEYNFKPKNLIQFKKYKTIAIIGMGGSVLGAEAIYYFLKKKIKKNFLFFDDLDESKILDFKKKKIFSKTLFIVISKSGNTVETLTNAFALNVFRKKSKNIIVISEKKDNNLFALSKRLNLFYIEHKNNIGGRYSVLSEVGMVPAYLMGVNISKIRSNIFQFLKVQNKTLLRDSSIKLATLLKSKKNNNLIFLSYFSELEKFLFWCQQLIGESLGKNNKGFLPVISKVPKDHHSLLQLYLDGPKDKLFYIFSFEKKGREKVTADKDFIKNFYFNKKKLSDIKNSQKKALIKSLKEKNIPYREFHIKKIDEETLGKLFSFFILETIIVGKLNGINPFDQPAVEKVKVYTKKFLKKNTKNNF